jgi:hypothetical protein
MLLEVGLTQNRETMALQTLTTVNLFYFAMYKDLHEIHWNSIWLRAQSHMNSRYTWGSVTTLHDFGGALEQPFDTFFWALTVSWTRLLAHGWSVPKLVATSLCHLADLGTAFLCKFQPSSATPQSFRGLQVFFFFFSTYCPPRRWAGKCLKFQNILDTSTYRPQSFVFFWARFVQWPRVTVYTWGPKQENNNK